MTHPPKAFANRVTGSSDVTRPHHSKCPAKSMRNIIRGCAGKQSSHEVCHPRLLRRLIVTFCEVRKPPRLAERWDRHFCLSLLDVPFQVTWLTGTFNKKSAVPAL